MSAIDEQIMTGTITTEFGKITIDKDRDDPNKYRLSGVLLDPKTNAIFDLARSFAGSVDREIVKEVIHTARFGQGVPSLKEPETEKKIIGEIPNFTKGEAEKPKKPVRKSGTMRTIITNLIEELNSQSVALTILKSSTLELEKINGLIRSGQADRHAHDLMKTTEFHNAQIEAAHRLIKDSQDSIGNLFVSSGFLSLKPGEAAKTLHTIANKIDATLDKLREESPERIQQTEGNPVTASPKSPEPQKSHSPKAAEKNPEVPSTIGSARHIYATYSNHFRTIAADLESMTTHEEAYQHLSNAIRRSATHLQEAELLYQNGKAYASKAITSLQQLVTSVIQSVPESNGPGISLNMSPHRGM